MIKLINKLCDANRKASVRLWNPSVKLIHDAFAMYWCLYVSIHNFKDDLIVFPSKFN